MAKLAACEAARFAARVALQCHGAIGYTWEQDLHLFMRRAWSLDQSWGRAPFHLRPGAGGDPRRRARRSARARPSKEALTMAEAYIIDAVRTPVGKRGGGLSRVHSADLGAHVISRADRRARASTRARSRT